MRVAIQGFGNAGQHIARLLAADGHAIVAVSDSNGAVKADGGLDLERLVAAKDGGGSVASTAGQAGHALLPGDELVGVDCDLLVPAALENLIDEDNAPSAKDRHILEPANGPVAPEAAATLEQNGGLVLPELLPTDRDLQATTLQWRQHSKR